MSLPADRAELVDAAVDVLRALGAQLRLAAARRPETPELWLSVRDCEGLGVRLAMLGEFEWQHGFIGLLTNGQDLGVLDELISGGENAPVQLTEAQARTLTQLRELLRDPCADG